MALALSATSYQPDPYFYNPTGWDTPYRTALASAGSRVVPIYALGDSLLRGGQATNFAQKSWWLTLIGNLKALHGDGGPGLRYIADTLDPTFFQGTLDLPSPDGVHGPWTFSAAAGAWSNTAMPYGVGGQHYYAANGSGATATLRESFTALDLWATKTSGSGSVAITIDGVPYDKNGVALGGGGNLSLQAPTTTVAVKVWSASGLSNIMHTMVLTQSASGSMNIGGAVCYGPHGAGILPLRCGRSGMSGSLALGNMTADSITGTLAMTPLPSLIIFAYGANDMQWGYAYAEYEAIVRRVAEAAKEIQASLLFLIPYLGVPFGWRNADQSHRYIEKVYAVAGQYNVAVYNINAAWNDLGANYLLATYKSSTPHPNDAGHLDIANRLKAILL